ncbi:cytochrome P450 [Gymnopus androsaceus JB14]|uniref:Cytochrome P450 n=1 Tax=Gymnopus androsaceus JB14 TaxID=1447944 RepID=A0A6A4HIE0_9AGAR|nr:cytochrome P450 [Gymnopus androsaceus JB14]
MLLPRSPGDLFTFNVTFLAVGGVLIYLLWSKGLNKKRYASFPGPPGLPLLGNVHQLGQQQHLKYTEWHAQYGPIIQLNFAGKPVLVVGNAKIAADLMDRRSAIYSDRPRFIMSSEILMGGMNMAFARYGDRWKRMKSAATQCLTFNIAQEYTPLQEIESLLLLRALIDAKGDVDGPVRRSAAASIMKVVYNYNMKAGHDPVVAQIETYVDRMLKAALPGSYIVDIFPFLNRLPAWAASWKREGQKFYQKDTQLFLDLVNDVKAGVVSGMQPDCLVNKLVDVKELNAVETAWLAGTMFGAGAEAMGATLSVFVLAMVLYPAVQEKLRQELYVAVGKDRFPSFQEISKNVYLNAVIKETLRWRPMGPLGVPHQSIKDDIYDGHFIAAGTLVIPNIWAMHHDEAVYPKAEEFRPERYISDAGFPINILETKDLGHHSYGFGRRACMGYTVANNALIINAAYLTLMFEMKKAKDEFGNEISPDPWAFLDEGLAVRPLPFKCHFEPLSKDLLATVKATESV